MPAIWNVGNTNGYSDKKISSKLTFEEGETFKGRVVTKGEGDSVVIKLIDGWQFSADLLDESGTDTQQLLQFKVEGFDGDKIKLKIIKDSQIESDTVEEDAVKEFINKEGISKDDFSILKGMIKFNIPLSKDNIEFVKSVFNLRDKLGNKAEIDEFINNYISGKGIDPKSPEAISIRNTLNEFFTAFETMEQDDILLFLESGIDINAENIDSYNKLFKGDLTIKEYFDNVAKEFQDLGLEKSLAEEKTNINTASKSDIINKESILKEAGDNESTKYSQKQTIGLKVYGDTTTSKSTVSLLNLLKTMTGGESNLTKDAVKDILITNKNLFKGIELKEAFSKLDSMSEKELQNSFKEAAGNGTVTKEVLEGTIKQLFGQEVKLSNTESSKLIDILNLNGREGEDVKDNAQLSRHEGKVPNNQDNVAAKSENNSLKETVKEGKIQEKMSLNNSGKLTSSTIVKNEIDGKLNSMKDVVRQLLSHSEELTGKTLEGKVAEFIKSNLNDFKLFNALSNEYYYLDVPVNRNNNEYPCKLIIKDDRKGSKQIDSSNVKMVVAVKTINMGTVDAYIKVINNSLNVDIKCINKYMKFLSKGTEQLTEKLSKLGYAVSVNVKEKLEEVSLTTCREFFDTGSNSALDIKV